MKSENDLDRLIVESRYVEMVASSQFRMAACRARDAEAVVDSLADALTILRERLRKVRMTAEELTNIQDLDTPSMNMTRKSLIKMLNRLTRED